VAPFARLVGVPLVMDVDSSIPDQLRYSGFATRGPLLWLADALELHALRHSVAAVTVCQSLTDGVRRRAPGVPVFQVEDPPLVDARQPPAAEVVETLRRELGLGQGPVVLYSGNFEPYQGVELLLEAVPLVAGAQFLFMGGRAAEIDALRARARELGAGARVFFSGTRPPTELAAFLALADVLCSPRVQGENTPFKIYSYLASGKPIVATRIATHTQLLDDSLAFLVPPTAESLAGGIGQALRDPNEARARAGRGLELIDREYSAARYREKIERAYAEVARRVRK
jgi:glycosyltransferase involved in cell wall biosynthesis